MKVIIARMDGTLDSGFAVGAIAPKDDLPVRENFSGPIIGSVPTHVEGDRLVADLPEDLANRFHGKYPAVGGRSRAVRIKNGVRFFEEFELIELSLCDQPNTDPTIGPLE